MTQSAVHHVGYFVDDIPRAVTWAVQTLGAGPFFLVDRLPFDEVTFHGEPGTYDHSSAFGQWGSVKIELTQVHCATPDGLLEMFSGQAPRVGHLAWLADDIDAETNRLQAAGLDLFHTGQSGPVRAHWFDARATLGHHIEVLQSTPQILGFYELISTSAQGWDGTRPLRPAPGNSGLLTREPGEPTMPGDLAASPVQIGSDTRQVRLRDLSAE